MFDRFRLPAPDGKHRNVLTNAGPTNMRVSDSSGVDICSLGTGDMLEVDKDGNYRVVRRRTSLWARIFKMSKRTG